MAVNVGIVCVCVCLSMHYKQDALIAALLTSNIYTHREKVKNERRKRERKKRRINTYTYINIQPKYSTFQAFNALATMKINT